MITKSQDMLYHLIQESNGIDDKTLLAKLEYFADFIHFAFYNKPISDENVIYTRQKMGPLARTLTEDLEALKIAGYIEEVSKYHYSTIKNIKSSLSKDELRTIRYVVQKYSNLGYKELVNICHNQIPYLSAQEGGVVELSTAYNLVDEYGDYKNFN